MVDVVDSVFLVSFCEGTRKADGWLSSATKIKQYHQQRNESTVFWVLALSSSKYTSFVGEFDDSSSWSLYSIFKPRKRQEVLADDQNLEMRKRRIFFLPSLSAHFLFYPCNKEVIVWSRSISRWWWYDSRSGRPPHSIPNPTSQLSQSTGRASHVLLTLPSKTVNQNTVAIKFLSSIATLQY